MNNVDKQYPEKIALIILSTIFFVGAVLLHVKQARARHDITIVDNGVKKVHTLEQVEKILVEKRKVPINSATPKELTAIPGIGEKTALKIIEYRDRKGHFNSPEDLLDIKGIGPAKLEKMRPFLKIE